MACWSLNWREKLMISGLTKMSEREICFLSVMPLQRSATAQGHVDLSAGEDAPGEVDGHLAERQALAFVDGDGPGQPQGKLSEGAELFLFNLFFFFVVRVAHVAPHFACDFQLVALFRGDVDAPVRLVDGRYDAQCAVHPSLVHVVLDKNDLRAGFHFQLHQGGERTFGEVALDFAGEGRGRRVYLGQFLAVDEVHVVAPRGQGDVQAVVRLPVVGMVVTAVEELEVGVSGHVGADMVEYGNEGGILLPVHLLQFDGHEAHFPEHLGREEIGRGIVAVQHLPFVGLDHRFELEYVPTSSSCLPPKGSRVLCP